MGAILILDLALVGLLLTSNIGRAIQGDSAAQWFAASLATGMLTLSTPWLVAEHASFAFVICNASGFLVGPCLVLHARALSNLYSNAGAEVRRPPASCWLPFVMALLVYAASSWRGIAPEAIELWMSIAKAVSLLISVTLAVSILIVLHRASPLGFGRHADIGLTITMVVVGLLTVPAAFIRDDAFALQVHDAAVLPALGVFLWLLACLRLQRFLPLPEPVITPNPEESPGILPERPDREAEDTILASVYQAFVQSLETDRGWLDADFGLDDAAKQLGLRRHLLSEAINQQVPGGFTAVVNSYRLAAFRAALSNAPESESLLKIGLRCGFGSKASLHRSVKRSSGLSPGELRREILGAHINP